MKILVLMKRFSSNKDQIKQNFGREVRLFSEIDKLGQTVTVLCADQQRKERLSTKLNGMKVEIYPFSLRGMGKFTAVARSMAKENDIVVGTSHPLLGYVAHLAATTSGRRLVFDLRDNYETYSLTRLPLLQRGLISRIVNNHVIKRADLVVCVSETLRQKVARMRKKATVVVPNGVSTKMFKPLKKEACRKKLGLPAEAPIIIYAGHISKDRGTDTLIRAFEIIREKMPDARLLLSGKVDRDIDIRKEGVIYKELPERTEVVMAINASDAAVLPQPENSTTKYTFPYKLMEYIACGVPVVATRVGDVVDVLKDYQGSLAEPGNAEDLAEKITAALSLKKRPDYSKIVEQHGWEKLARKLNSELVKLRR